MQRGSALPILLLLIVIIVASLGSIYFFSNLKETELSKVQDGAQTQSEDVDQKTEASLYVSNVIASENTSLKFSSNQLKFEFSYPDSLSVKEDTEKEFNERENGDFRKNFKGYIGYEPPKFLGAVNVLDSSKLYQTNPLTIWVFENLDNLSIEKWYTNFWYYPFVWGDFTLRRNDVAPTQDFTVNTQPGKFGTVTYRPGEPKFVYVPYNNKMFLFRTVGEEGNKILENFKFLN